MDQGKIGKFIATLRKEKNLTQLQLGEKVGVSYKTVSKWETGRYMPDISLLKSLSEVLGVSIDEILIGERIVHEETEEAPTPMEVKNETSLKVIKSYVNSAKKSIVKKSVLVVGIIVLLFIALLALLLVKNNYDNCYVYNVVGKDEKYLIEGVFTATPEQNILSINSIKNLMNFELDMEMVYDYEYTLFLGEAVLKKHGGIESYEYNPEDVPIYLNDVLTSIHIYVSEEHDYNDILKFDDYDGMYLQILYINQDQKECELNIPIHLTKLFSNDKIVYNGGFDF